MTGRRAPDSVGKCSRGVTDAVVKDANWRANNACIDANIDRGEGAYLTPAERVSLTIETVAPVIAEAGYRQGVEDAKARIQEVKLGPHANREEIETFRAEVDAVLTALTDTEGREAVSVEGRSAPAATTDPVVKTNPEEGEN